MKKLRMVLLIISLWSFELVAADGGFNSSELLSRYSYQVSYSMDRQEQSNGARKSCWVFEVDYTVDYPSNPNEPLQIESTLYIPNPEKTGAQTLPTVILLPPTGGVNTLDKFMAKDFCKENIAGLIIENDFTGFDGKTLPPVSDHMESFHRTAAAIKGAMIFVEENPRLTTEKLGLFGVSLGGILGSIPFSVEDSFSAGYFLVSGGNIPSILAYSTQDEVARLRKLRMKDEDLKSQEDYETYLVSHIDHDNTDLTTRVPSETVRMIISNKDKKVPTPRQYELQEAFNNPETRISNSKHVSTVVNNMLWGGSRQTMIQFFQDRFAMENPRISRGDCFLRDLDVSSKH